MKQKLTFIFAVLTICTSSIFAQNRVDSKTKSRVSVQTQESVDSLTQAYNDSLAKVYADSMVKAYADSILQIVRQRITSADVPLTSNGSYKLFSPFTYYRSNLTKRLNMDSNESDRTTVDDAVDDILLNFYLTHPELVQTTEAQLVEASAIESKLNKPIVPKAMDIVDNTKKVTIVDNVVDEEKNSLVIEKPNFWTLKGDYYLQFLQNYISDNWYKGGESNYSFLAGTVLEANYNNKQKVTWDNKLEMKLGFQTTRGDTLHTFKTHEDLIRYTGTLGIQATKKWYYTFQVITYTQFTSGYKSNDKRIYSDFFSPFNANFSLGMSYNVQALNNKLTGKINLSPLAYNYRFVGRKDLAKNYGIRETRHHMEDYGSKINADLTWQLMENLKWRSRFYAYTTYKRVEMEWENTFTFSFNKYISTNVFIYPRFDDMKKRDKDYGYFQLKEYASLGFNYSF